MKKNKTNHLILIFLFLAFIVIFGYKFLSENLTSGWKTYVDSNSRILIKYPPNWKTEESAELLISSKGTHFYKERKKFLPGIHIYFSPWALVEKELVSRNYQIVKESLKEAKTKIGSYEFTTIYFTKELPISYYSLDLNGGSYIFVARGKEEEKVLEKMLSTLVINKAEK